MHVLQEDLREAGMAVHLPDRVDGDARRVEREEDQRQPLVTLAAGSAEQAERPVGEGGAAGPDLVAVQNVGVALEFGGRSNAGQVAAGLRFRPGLRPDLVPSGHWRQEARLLFGRTIFDESWAQQEDAVLIDPPRCAGPVIFFLENQPLDEVQPASAVFRRPGDHAPVAGFQRALPGPVRFEALAAGVEMLQRMVRNMGFEPGSNFGPKCLLLG